VRGHRSGQTTTDLERHFFDRLVAGSLIVLCASCGHAGVATPDRDARPPVRPGTLIDALSDDGDIQHFRIESVISDPRDRDGDVSLYGVSVLSPASKTWQPYCVPDADGRSAAIPIEGSWSAFGDFEPGAAGITFACTSGAIGKCIRFGYKPWKNHRGISLQPYHAACVHMVRADYCGDGRPHTVDGTWIDMWDSLGIQTRDERDGHPEVFEAAWSPSGAAYLNVPRWSNHVADVVDECPDHFGGRTSRDRQLDPSEVQQQFPDALIFNARFIRSQDRRIVPGRLDLGSSDPPRI
jgi:hypothetical protein